MESQINEEYLSKLSSFLQKRIQEKAQSLGITVEEAYWKIREEDMEEDRQERDQLYKRRK